jgi:hypothetical protein
MIIKINLPLLLRIEMSSKDFFIYDVKNKQINNYIFTNDLYRHRHKYGKNSKFILVDVLKKQTKNLTIKL